MRNFLVLMNLCAICMMIPKQIKSANLNTYTPRFPIKLHRYGIFDASRLAHLNAAYELKLKIKTEIEKEEKRLMNEVLEMVKQVWDNSLFTRNRSFLSKL
jgi:hypothetical protein